MAKPPRRRQRTETQHFVPQFYLRRFCNVDDRLHAYDKVAGRTHPTSTHAAAQQSNFYEIPPGSFENGEVPVNTVENALSLVERTWAPLHAALIEAADAGCVADELFGEYAPFLVMQWMRTKTFRDTMFQTAQKSMQSLVDELVALNFPGERVTLKLHDDAMIAEHAQALFAFENVERMADKLRQHLWLIGVNNTEHLFYTSDHPVVRRANRVQYGRRLVGLQDPGIEFAFPLDPRHILMVLERTHFADWSSHENQSVVLTAEKVRDYNALQVMRSDRRVFCSADDFELARQVCREHPELRDPARPRVRVDTTPIVSSGIDENGKPQMKNYTIVTALE